MTQDFGRLAFNSKTEGSFIGGIFTPTYLLQQNIPVRVCIIATAGVGKRTYNKVVIWDNVMIYTTEKTSLEVSHSKLSLPNNEN